MIIYSLHITNNLHFYTLLNLVLNKEFYCWFNIVNCEWELNVKMFWDVLQGARFSNMFLCLCDNRLSFQINTQYQC